jgi:hypothetical protein
MLYVLRSSLSSSSSRTLAASKRDSLDYIILYTLIKDTDNKKATKKKIARELIFTLCGVQDTKEEASAAAATKRFSRVSLVTAVCCICARIGGDRAHNEHAPPST